MKTKILILLLCVLAFSPVVDAFNFGDVVNFFEDVFGPADITGMTIGGTCRADRDCGAGDEVCYSGACVQLCENERSDTECAKLLKKKRVNDPETYFCSLRVDVGRVARDICLQPTCGNDKLEGREVCDDGNTDADDGCAPRCLRVTPGWTCNNDRMPSVCTPICGDAIMVGREACDDGDTDRGDGCGALCLIEVGWTCNNGRMPSVCTSTCGDGRILGLEACDDGDTDNGDGCSSSCAIESGYTCSGAPSSCSATCGDGIVAGDEECDNGVSNANTGACKADCTDAVGGDGYCYAAEEDCDLAGYNREDCGKCEIYDKEPVVTISGVDSSIDAEGSRITINITNATSCYYSLFEVKTVGSGRGERIKLEELGTKERFPCNSASSTLKDIIDFLPGSTKYAFEILAGNNIGITPKASSTFVIGSGRTIKTKGFDSSQFYTNLRKPLIEVIVFNGNAYSCSWTLNSGCDEIRLNSCPSSWEEIDIVAGLESCLTDGKNTFIFKVDKGRAGGIEKIKKRINFIKTKEQAVRLTRSSSGVRRKEGSAVTFYPVVISRSDHGKPKRAINVSENVTLAALAVHLSLKKKGRVPTHLWKEIANSIASYTEVEKVFGALGETNFKNIKIGAAPIARIKDDAVTADVKLFLSKLNEDGNYSISAEEEVHKVEITTLRGNKRKITIHSNPVTIELEVGECKAVDINEDGYEDLIVCYDEENGVTMNNIVELDDNLESPIDEDKTIISPITYSTVNEYIVTVDREELEKEILSELPDYRYDIPIENIKNIEIAMLKKYGPIIVIVTIMLLYIIFVAAFALENDIKKAKKKK